MFIEDAYFYDSFVNIVLLHVTFPIYSSILFKIYFQIINYINSYIRTIRLRNSNDELEPRSIKKSIE